ncbi:Membrane protein involved in the export of O-antigen and teichoic acid [Halomicrobium zhouii]|uniref:Membrane protein involved in the export of O-antigen and teichoic acid n=1 Tax=Halomicrobium zhouii TaxID=767519 RepID=A0A1I6LSX2_9EURY|nr:oligosaccharide flippase family protein [Halomicrobium zhouii]SFS06561.1 Membrane protein involved in the export of O-antigen and teichoic acid [Halomicrobium zhouii]
MSEDKNQAIRDIVKGASIVYVGLFLELLIAFVAQVIAARYLSVSEFGGLTAGTALLDIGSILAGLGLASGLTRYLPRIGDEEKRMLASTTIVITFVTSVLLGTVVTLNASFIASEIFGNPEVTVSIRTFGAAIPFAALLNVSVGGIRGQERSLYRVYVKNIIHPVTRFVLVIGAVVYGLGQVGLASAYAAPYIVSGAIALLLLHRTLPRTSSSFDSELFTRVTRYSLPFTISGVTGFVYRSIDIFLILYFLGDTATGIYGVAYAAVSFMGMYSTAFNYLGSPIASKLESDGNVDDVMDMFSSVARWLVIASVCTLVPLGVFSTEFISIIYESKYASGGPVLLILAAGFAAKNVLSIHSPILESLGLSKTISFNSVVAAAVNLGLNILLIPEFGITGAAVATVISFLVRDGLAAVEVYYHLGTTPISWQVIRPVAVAIPSLTIFATIIAPEIPTTIPWLIGATGSFTVSLVLGVLFVFGLSKTEVMVIRSAEERYNLNLGPFDRLVRHLARR